MTSALAAAGENTFDDALYSDVTAARPDLVALRRRVSVEPTANGPGSTITVRLRDGRSLSRTVDVAIPVRDLPAQQEKLERKFRHLVRNALTEDAAERVVAICRDLEHEPDLGGLMNACAGIA
jgi:2-methylcitrate dehydratase PrpD